MEPEKKSIYFENLDGLRFLCFLSVFLFHSFHTEYDALKLNPVYHFVKRSVFGNGNLGVNFFFVLSGFLITYLLIQEKKSTGKIHIAHFWMRRILRIWPLYYFCVFFGFVAFPFLKSAFGQTPNETAHLINYLTFTNNFDFISTGSPDSSVLAVLWSVAIEEQFYLLWPVVLFLFPLKKYWIPFTVIILSSLVFRATHDDDTLFELHSLSCIGDMAVGAFGAWLIMEKASFLMAIQNLKKPQLWLIYGSFILIFFFRKELFFNHYPLRVVERILIAGNILFIILEQCFCLHSLFKVSNLKMISRLGIITYGLYCLHFVGILIATTLTKKFALNTQLWQVLLLDTALALLLTIGISKLSYRFYELPFLKLKEKFAFVKNRTKLLP